MKQPASDFDGAWKYALEQYFERFMEFFFPEIHAAIDWDQPITFCDQELAQIAPDDQAGKQRVDKLVQVMRRDGTPATVVIHLEVQSQREALFPERIFCYHARIFDRERCPVVSLVILGDEDVNWHPDRFGYELWGCELGLRFPTVKLRDLDPAALAATHNPFAVLTLLHRDAQETRRDPNERLRRKLQRYRALLRQGYHGEDVRRLLRLIEHLLRLDPERATQARDAMRAIEREETGMDTFVTSFEEIGRAEGRMEGRMEGQRELIVSLLQRKAGPLSADLQARITALSPAHLLELSEALLDLTGQADLLAWLNQHAGATEP